MQEMERDDTLKLIVLEIIHGSQFIIIHGLLIV